MLLQLPFRRARDAGGDRGDPGVSHLCPNEISARLFDSIAAPSIATEEQVMEYAAL